MLETELGLEEVGEDRGFLLQEDKNTSILSLNFRLGARISVQNKGEDADRQR